MTVTEPLPTLLSHLYVAYVVELDNEFERRVPHWREGLPRTPEARALPRLVSLAIWATCLRHVPDAGITLAELERVARTDTNLDGVRRWGYITIAGRARRGPAGPARRSDLLVPTETGRVARDACAELVPEIERRWADRFGAETVGSLLDSLRAVDAVTGGELPDCLPILGYGMWCAEGLRSGEERGAPTSLYGLLGRVLLAFALDVERDTTVSVAIGANVLRRVGMDAAPAADLPRRGGVSREAVATAVRYLEKQGLMTIGTTPDGGRARIARLTQRGLEALRAHDAALVRIEGGWQKRLGGVGLTRLRDAAAALANDADGTPGRLLASMRPSPGEWRSEIPAPTVLPDFPTVLHRGGWPDGS